MTEPCQDRATILVVDDTPANIDVLSEVLRSSYRVRAATSGERALVIAAAMPQPDMILMDVMMPGLDGLETCIRLKADPLTSHIPIIFVTAMSEIQDEERGLSVGAVDYITKPISPPIVLSRIRTHLALFQQNKELEVKVRERTNELAETRFEIIRRLGRAAEFRDNETGLHVIRMSHYARLIAQSYCPDTAWADLLYNAAPMHDVGKIGIPDAILLKPGRLDDDEWEIMRSHPMIGAKILDDGTSEVMLLSREIALAHHEKWDGTGYPRSLSGTDIPIAARIIAVADVFDALTTERPYKKAWTVEKAVGFLTEQSNKHFDVKLVGCFMQRLADIMVIREKYAEKENLF
jgi:putative two-component system response regulator